MLQFKLNSQKIAIEKDALGIFFRFKTFLFFNSLLW